MTPGACVLCTSQHPATRGHACDRAFERLDDQLRAVEAETVLLSAAPSLAQRSGTRGGTLASERSPARLDVLALTDPRTRPDWDNPALSVLGVLGGWARAVREDRDLAWPERVTVASERRTLALQLEWVCAQPWVDEFAQDVRRLLGQLRAANGTGAERPMARCVVPHPEGLCGGNIWVQHVTQTVWRSHRDRCDAETVDVPDGPATCDVCGSRWETDADKARLNAMIRDTHDVLTRPRTDDDRPMLTVQELATELGISVNATYIRLSRAGVRAVNGYYDPRALTACHVA
jgi:hypothetical protein